MTEENMKKLMLIDYCRNLYKGSRRSGETCRTKCVMAKNENECGVKFDAIPDEMIHKFHAMAFPEAVAEDSDECMASPKSMSHDKKMEYIRSKLDENELLCQLAEEAAELSKAALKLSRIIRGKNPTPVTHKEALENVFEELADVRVCMIALGYHQHDFSIALRMPDKINRWVDRLQKMGGEQ